jgi:hypothetical protein
MKLPTPLYLLFVLLFSTSAGLTAAQANAMPADRMRAATAREHSPANAAENIFNLADFGAVGDGVADDGPALQNALDAIAESGGGTLLVPAGRYAIITPVQKDFTGLAAEVWILGVESLTPVPPPTAVGAELSAGLNLVSEFAPRTGEQGISINITGLQTFLVKDITFIGTSGVSTDAFITLALNNIREATVRHCEFYGLSSLVAGGAILQSVWSNLKIEQSVFLGSTANSGVNTSVVQNVDWKGLTIADTLFVDYGQRAELYGKLSFASPLSWVNIGNAAAPENESPRRQVVITNVFIDEGAVNGLSSLPQLTQSAPIDLLYVSGLYANVSNLNASGNYLSGLNHLLIEKSHYGWSHAADAAINLLNVDSAILDRVDCVDSAGRIRADSTTGTLTVIDSVYDQLDSLAQTTRVITTNAIEEDPVQHVRQQFTATLGRDPDPAALFYWSDRLLKCGEDAQCPDVQRAALAAYLNAGPLADFSISGQVTDESGAGLPGVVVTLSGSQSVTTETGSDGRYFFAGLPTSGTYAVTPQKTNCLFAPANMTFLTPGVDQVADFGVTPPSVFDFGAPSYSVTEGTRTVTVTVTRSGNTSTASEVTYSGLDGSAGQHSDVIPVIGLLRFEPGETSKSFIVFITDDSYVEGDESLMLELSNPEGGILGNTNTAMLTISDNDSAGTTLNPIDDPQFFVRQQYRDFLNRPPDHEGFVFWTNEITSCGSNAACIADRRTNVSAAFFLSIEFQQTGFLVYRLYKASFAQQPQHLDEFLLDTRIIGDGVIVNAPGWESLLETNKVAFIENFVARPQFIDVYPLDLTPAEFVDQLNARAGDPLSPDEVTAAVAEFEGASSSEAVAARARVLRQVAENPTLSQRELNPAFVLMQYFGYLQRNPSDPPDSNLNGYNFWLAKLAEFGGDFRRAEMVKSFLVSSEYRARFGAP